MTNNDDKNYELQGEQKETHAPIGATHNNVTWVNCPKSPPEAFEQWWSKAAEKFPFLEQLPEEAELQLKTITYSAFATGLSYASASPPAMWCRYLDKITAAYEEAQQADSEESHPM